MLSEENWNALADFTHDFCKKTEKNIKGIPQRITRSRRLNFHKIGELKVFSKSV